MRRSDLFYFVIICSSLLFAVSYKDTFRSGALIFFMFLYLLFVWFLLIKLVDFLAMRSRKRQKAKNKAKCLELIRGLDDMVGEMPPNWERFEMPDGREYSLDGKPGWTGIVYNEPGSFLVEMHCKPKWFKLSDSAKSFASEVRKMANWLAADLTRIEASLMYHHYGTGIVMLMAPDNEFTLIKDVADTFRMIGLHIIGKDDKGGFIDLTEDKPLVPVTGNNGFRGWLSGLLKGGDEEWSRMIWIAPIPLKKEEPKKKRFRDDPHFKRNMLIACFLVITCVLTLIILLVGDSGNFRTFCMFYAAILMWIGAIMLLGRYGSRKQLPDNDRVIYDHTNLARRIDIIRDKVREAGNIFWAANESFVQVESAIPDITEQ